jgi:hypothetical protein
MTSPRAPLPLAALLLIACSCAAPPAGESGPGVPPAAASPQPSYFPTQVGARWVYQGSDGEESSLVVSAVEEKGGAKIVSVALAGPNGEHFVVEKVWVSDAGLYAVAMGGQECNPPVCKIRLPPKAGDRWETLSIVGLPVRELCEVFGAEQVAVPAGCFQAVRVEANGTGGFGGAWTKTTTWYAPEVGMVKRVVGENETMVLKSFTPGGAPGSSAR